MTQFVQNFSLRSLDQVTKLIADQRPLETDTYKIDVHEVFYDQYNITVTSKNAIFSNLEVEILLFIIIGELSSFNDINYRVYNLSDAELWNYSLRHKLTALEREELELVYRGITIDGQLLHHLSYGSYYNCTIKNFVANNDTIIQKAIFHNVIFDGCTFDDVTFLECEFVNCQCINSVKLHYISFDHCIGEPIPPNPEEGIVYFGFEEYDEEYEESRTERTYSLDSFDERQLDEIFGC